MYHLLKNICDPYFHIENRAFIYTFSITNFPAPAIIRNVNPV